MLNQKLAGRRRKSETRQYVLVYIRFEPQIVKYDSCKLDLVLKDH